MEGKVPGTGNKSPFGNGNGGGGSAAPKVTGAHDFISEPTSMKSGSADARDFTKENPEQEEGSDENKKSIPDGGKTLLADPPAKSRSPIGAPGSKAKPYKLRGK